MKLSESDDAVKVANSLQQLQQEKDARSYHIGKMGCFAKDMKNFLKAVDHPTWTSFCSGYGLNANTLNSYVRLYRTYGPDGLNIPVEQWVAIGPRKLEIISKDISGNNTEDAYLLDNAQSLSVSDLLTSLGRETKIGKNKRHGETSNGDAPPIPYFPHSLTQYRKLVKSSPCCVCGREGETTYAHWPRTGKRGEFGIPLCGRCHRLQEDTAKSDWFRDHFVNISQWLDRLIGG